MSEEPITGPEHLTPFQRQYLRNLRGYFDTPPTLARIYAKLWRPYLLLLLLTAPVIAMGILFDVVGLSFLMGAFVAGALVRDLGWFVRSIRLWPVVRAITDRERLEELTADPPHDSYTHDGP